MKARKIVAYGYWPEYLKLDWAKVGVFIVEGVDRRTLGNRHMFNTDIAAKGCLNGKLLSVVTRDMWKF